MIDVLSDLFILRGIPAYIRSDNGPEFLVRAVLNRAAHSPVRGWPPLRQAAFFIVFVFVLVIVLLIIVVGVSRRYRIAHLGDEDSSRPTS